ncbi:MAG: hypothetical protein HUJ61_04010, partial [Bacilli bacterium]|nr:hypothetical protein [Bacilli bacterium]
PRNYNYELEWGNNFILGDNEDIAIGFQQSVTKSVNELKDYVTKYNITGDIKLWNVGYSKGAGVSNILAGYLDDHPDCLGNNTIINPSDLYNYSFEAPKLVTKTKATAPKENPNLYNNIYYIHTEYDLITQAFFDVDPTRGWDFTYYGIDKTIYINEDVLNYLSFYPQNYQEFTDLDMGSIYHYRLNINIDDILVKDLSKPVIDQHEFINDHMEFVAKHLLTREEYHHIYSNDLIEILNFVMGSDSLDKFLKLDLKKYLTKGLNCIKAVIDTFSYDMAVNNIYTTKDGKSLSNSKLESCINELINGHSIPSEYISKVDQAYYVSALLLKSMIKDIFNELELDNTEFYQYFV